MLAEYWVYMSDGNGSVNDGDREAGLQQTPNHVQDETHQLALIYAHNDLSSYTSQRQEPPSADRRTNVARSRVSVHRRPTPNLSPPAEKQIHRSM